MSMTTYIKNDLASRLKSGHGLPAQQTIDSLAAYYHVSFTPVRTAVAELIDEGLLQKGPNRRLVIRIPPQATLQPLPSLTQPARPQDSFDMVASDLVQLSLQGEPVYLREEATAEKYDISRSAMRYILHRLAGEGVLDHIPRRGWLLRPFRQDDLKSYIEVREALELKALELALPKLDSNELRRMLDCNQSAESPGAAPRIDESLHQYFITLADNAYIRDFFERQGRYYRLLFQWEDHEHEIASETVRQHREILSALLDRNGSAARKALSKHILYHPILSPVAITRAKLKEVDDQETA